MESPLVTIVVVSYYQSKYIEENLNSIKAQTYPNIELIVADDASPDNSVEVFETWLKENNYPAKKNYHTKNTGLATVLNKCIELATGKYIKLIAADDFLHPQAIEKSVTKLEELGDEYGMVFTDTFSIDEESDIIVDIADYNQLGLVDPLFFRQELIKGNRIAALTVLMRLDVVKHTGKYDSEFIIEDYYRWLKINEKYFIGYIPEKLAYYRQHENNISKTKAERIELEDLKLKLMFDRIGVAKHIINNKMYIKYVNNYQFESQLKVLYNNYPFKIKRLDMAIKYNLPIYFYKLISRFF
ncbi:glycosyltransferase family 2 protein [Empedobacter falsenii]|uniref:glycosyltransferase family 2 protein n=1 Tax=Empedobacter TaxID=59734 RepID=UPI0025778E03|nr:MULTISPECIES: glycosyltransferase [Empedobacter]MDM1040609.1 glycosyltransferase [Empedobacter brevis]MDM1135616.1 glycosyltransferase [Empedobacter sp. R750]